MKLKNILMLIAMITAGASTAQHTLRINSKGLASSQGKVSAALYADQGSFLKFDEVFRSASAKAEKGVTTLVLEHIPEGKYAVAVFHDRNGNGKLDTNMLGIPKEPVAFSKAKMKMFGPPKFSECAFSIAKDTEIIIPFD